MQFPVKSALLAAEDIAKAWRRNDIVAAVVHGLEGYPQELGRDLDVLMTPEHAASAFAIARDMLMARGYVVLTPPPTFGDRLVAISRHDLYGDWLEIHTVLRLSWACITFVSKPSPSVRIGPFPEDPWASVVKRIFLPFLSLNVEGLRKNIDALTLDDSEYKTARMKLPPLVGNQTSEAFLNLLRDDDHDAIYRLGNRFRRRLIVGYVVRHPLAAVETSYRWLRGRLLRFFSPCGPIVALVGPDGVGKSETIQRICQRPHGVFAHAKVVVRHWRPGLLPRLGVFVGRPAPVPDADGTVAPRRTPGRLQWLRLGYYFLDFILGYVFRDRMDSACQRLVIYDRCALDMVVDPIRYGLSSTRGTRLLWHLIPKPDLIILLYDEPGRIHSRKSELSAHEIGVQIKNWMLLRDQGKIDAVVRVDVTPGEVANRVQDLILQRFMQMNGGGVDSGLFGEEQVSD